MFVANDVTGQVTGLIPTILAIGIVKKTSDAFLGKESKFPKMQLPKGGLFKKKE